MNRSVRLKQQCTEFIKRHHKLINPDVQCFEKALLCALVAMFGVMLVSSGLWFTDSRQVIMVVPAEKYIEECSSDKPDTSCVSLQYRLSTERYNPFTVVDVTGISSIVASVVFSVVAFVTSNNKSEVVPTGFAKWVSRFIVVGVIGGFVWVMAEVLAIMVSLVVVSSNVVPTPVAVLTAGVLVGLVSFTIVSWCEKLNVNSIGGFAILVLVVSLYLSIFFTTSDWSNAFSALGTNSHGLFVAGGNGSVGLFRFTFVSMGFLVVAYVIDITYLYRSNSDMLHKHGGTIAVLTVALGVIIGLGANVVGFVPYDSNPTLHNFGAMGAPLAAIALVALLYYAFPYHAEHSYRNNRRVVRLLGGGIIVVLLFVGTINFLKLGNGMITTLEAEFVFIFCLLLFLQVFSLYVTEFLDEEKAERANQNFPTVYLQFLENRSPLVEMYVRVLPDIIEVEYSLSENGGTGCLKQQRDFGYDAMPELKKLWDGQAWNKSTLDALSRCYELPTTVDIR